MPLTITNKVVSNNITGQIQSESHRGKIILTDVTIVILVCLYTLAALMGKLLLTEHANAFISLMHCSSKTILLEPAMRKSEHNSVLRMITKERG